MRVLLDEHLPIGLAALIQGHEVETVSGRGWTGIKNGELLRRMRGPFDALITMDQGIEFQQNLTDAPFGILLIHAASNRMTDLQGLVPAIIDALSTLAPGEMRHLGRA